MSTFALADAEYQPLLAQSPTRLFADDLGAALP